jgi:hypothetical protein
VDPVTGGNYGSGEADLVTQWRLHRHLVGGSDGKNTVTGVLLVIAGSVFSLGWRQFMGMRYGGTGAGPGVMDLATSTGRKQKQKPRTKKEAAVKCAAQNEAPMPAAIPRRVSLLIPLSCDASWCLSRDRNGGLGGHEVAGEFEEGRRCRTSCRGSHAERRPRGDRGGGRHDHESGGPAACCQQVLGNSSWARPVSDPEKSGDG